MTEFPLDNIPLIISFGPVTCCIWIRFRS